MGVGYWSGVGLLLDSGGADTYYSQYYCQGSVAHCGAGLMLDMGDGNDIHSMLRKNGVDGGQGAALGFVWDHGTALFVNENGNDTYAARTTSCGVSWAAYDAIGPEKQNGSYAIFLDGGYDSAQKFVVAAFEETIEKAAAGKLFSDYKSEIQELLQAKGRAVNITYEIDREEGPAHDKTFYVRLECNGQVLGRGSGKSKKEAEQNAARSALERGEI
jgi:hypothetical protein